MTHSELKALLHYNQDTGIFTWLVSKLNNKIKVGSIAGTLKQNGYLHIGIDKKAYKAHRLAWFYVHGKWPTIIDHINGNKIDNRLCNLREVTNQQNAWNASRYSTNTSGVKGLSWISTRNRYKICFQIDGKLKHFGYFKKEEFEKAKKLAIEIMSKLHGKYANHG